MKKIMKMLLLAAVFTLALSVSAFAAGAGADAGICDVDIEAEFASTVTVTPKTANGDTATKNASGVYKDAERVTVTFSGATASKYYLVVALDDEKGIPTVGDDGENNVAYINQVTASSTSVSFDVYPKALVSGQTYTVYISSNDGMGYKPVASFSYYAPFTPGDVNMDKVININDAMSVINHIVSKEILTGNNLLAAEVTKDSPINVNINDAMEIINYIVGKPEYLGK